MKHWIEFLSKKSYKARRLGKIIQAYEYEILEAKAKVEMYESYKTTLEVQIYDELEKHYTDTEALMQDIAQAREKAEKWNSEPINDHKPHTQKKPPKNGTKNPE